MVPNSCEAWVGSRPGRSVYPRIVTPPGVTTFWPATLPATLPPFAAAMSTTTVPGFIEATIASVNRRGAGRPGMRAVVMTMSTSAACSAYIFAALVSKSALVSLA